MAPSKGPFSFSGIEFAYEEIMKISKLLFSLLLVLLLPLHAFANHSWLGIEDFCTRVLIHGLQTTEHTKEKRGFVSAPIDYKNPTGNKLK